jgi:hypothetical protein
VVRAEQLVHVIDQLQQLCAQALGRGGVDGLWRRRRRRPGANCAAVARATPREMAVVVMTEVAALPNADLLDSWPLSITWEIEKTLDGSPSGSISLLAAALSPTTQ